MSDPVTWLDVLVLIAAYLLACLLYKAIRAVLRARDTFDELTETGGEVAPDPQDGGTADTSRAVCNDPAASPPHDPDMTLPLDCRGEGHELEEEMPDCRTCWPLVQRWG